jgi:hypothetical protein
VIPTSTTWPPSFPEFAAPEKKGGRPPRDERVIAGFEEIQRFVESMAAPRSTEKTATSSSGCMPSASTACARLRTAAPCLRRWTIKGLLTGAPSIVTVTEEAIDVDELAAELGTAKADSITVLRHVRTSADKRAAEEIADRKKCEDFETFKPLFARVETEVKTGLRQSQPIGSWKPRYRGW